MSVAYGCSDVLPDVRRHGRAPASSALRWSARRRVLLPATTALAAVTSVFLTAGAAQWLVALAGCAAVVLTAWPVADRRHRHVVGRHPLALLAVGLWLTVAGEVLHAAGAAYPSSADALELAAYPVLILGLLRLVKARLRERPLDTLLLAAIVPACLGALIWLPVLRALDESATPQSAPWIALPFLAIDLLAIAMLARLTLMFRGRPVAYQLLLAAFGALLGAHISRAAASVTNVVPAPFGSQTLLLLAFGLLAAAALHPTLLPTGKAQRARPAPIGRAHVAFLGAAVVAGPAAATVQYHGQGQWVLVAVGGPAVISLLVIAHLGRLVREHGRLEHESHHDDLTGLPNRAQFYDRLARELGAPPAPSLAVGFLDLDRFKKVNDSLGHDAGDELLRQVAARLQEHVRDGDVVARLSGDEFGLLLADLPDPAQAAVTARRLLTAFVAPFHVAGHQLYVTPSIGVALAEGCDDNADELVKRADLAMYEAKRRGRNTVEVYSGRLAADAHQQLVVETRLHAGIDAGELAVHYQPKVSLQTGAVTGVEALVRWQHPELGLVPPGAFIGLAEENGLVAAIGERVLTTACHQVQQWRTAGAPDLTLSVNLSVRQFQLQDVTALVVEALRSSGLPPWALELELTESSELVEADGVRQVLNALRELGVRCSIDDFGTGYTGIAYLNTLPMDTIKLDKSFIDVIGPDSPDAPFVRAMIAMAHSLGLDVVAEGVETEQQARFLREHACDTMQGYLFSRPLAAEDLCALLREGPSQQAVPAPATSFGRTVTGMDAKELGALLWAAEQRDAPRLALLVAAQDGLLTEGTAARRALVMTSAAGVLVVPMVLGLASAGALPAAAQHNVSVAFATLGATGAVLSVPATSVAPTAAGPAARSAVPAAHRLPAVRRPAVGTAAAPTSGRRVGTTTPTRSAPGRTAHPTRKAPAPGSAPDPANVPVAAGTPQGPAPLTARPRPVTPPAATATTTAPVASGPSRRRTPTRPVAPVPAPAATPAGAGPAVPLVAPTPARPAGPAAGNRPGRP